MTETSKEMAKVILAEMEDDYQENPMETWEQYQDRRLREVQRQVDDATSDFVEGMKLLFAREPQVEDDGSVENPEPMPSLDEVMQRLGNVSADATPEHLQEAAGLTPFLMARLYHAGWSFMEEKRYDHAQKAMSALTGLNPSVGMFWTALGEAFEHDLKQDDAISAYAMAIEADPFDLVPYARIALLAKLQGNQKMADATFAYAKEQLEQIEDQRTKTDLMDQLQSAEEFVRTHRN